MNAFIIRPFGTKNGVDFERVDRNLISAALDRLQIVGRTTQEIAYAGNIRADMFQLLLTADVAIADISIHNANVFYELGVRHALRDKATILLRASIDEVPFDLKTDRYLSYDPANPEECLDRLVKTISDTRRNDGVDSPVYSMLPGLSAPDASKFVVVPNSFLEEVDRARKSGTTGDLRFLASELTGLRWRREGLRVVGEAQFQAGDMRYAAETWEWVRSELPQDITANLRLGTIYQKLGDLTRSDEALRRVLSVKTASAADLAETRALLGSNAKTRWLAEWRPTAAPADRQAQALRSPHLSDAFEEYRKGFENDPSHYYSGINALALNIVLLELAAALPDVWLERFPDEDDSKSELKRLGQLRTQLTGAVDFSLCARKQRLEREEKSDLWLPLTFADYAFLTGKPNARQLFYEALARLESFARTVARRQFDIFQALGILQQAVDRVAPIFPAEAAGKAAVAAKVLLFTGHRIDAIGRKAPRFPPEKEEIARAAIEDAVRRELPGADQPVVAISGGASGGDLLFLEACEKLGVRDRRLYLVIPRDEYVTASVAPPDGPDGASWIARFQHQYSTALVREYQKDEALPDWLQDKPDYGVWQRSNAWMLHNALAIGGDNTTLIALWDGKGGDGPGGTQHMVETAAGRGARTVVLDTVRLFGL